jgi:hypothetical protein
MNILMTNVDLDQIGGTQTWTKTIATTLVRQGHKVSFMSPIIGTYYNKELASLGVASTIFDFTRFDLALVNHPIAFHIVLSSGLFSIGTIHGPFHPLEVPCIGMNKLCCVSEEIAARFSPVFPEMEVIRQPIDFSNFYFLKSKDGGFINTALKDDKPCVLVNCKNKTAMEMAVEACKKVGYNYEVIHYTEKPTYNPAEMMQGCNMAITSGRGVVEAMACGTMPLIFSCRMDPKGRGMGINADGWVTGENVDKLATVNFSGRYNGFQWDVNDLAKELTDFSYKPSKLWDWIIDQHDSENIVKRYLAIAEEGKIVNLAS